MAKYRGLSGIDSALYAALCLHLLAVGGRRAGDRVTVALGALLGLAFDSYGCILVSSPPVVGLLEQLHGATSKQRGALKSRPFFAALSDGTLELDRYVAWLRALTTVTGALEASLQQLEGETLRHLAPRLRLDALRADAATYDEVAMPHSGLVAPTIEFAECLRGWGAEQPRALVGALYVFESAAFDAHGARPGLSRFERDGAGVGYWTALSKQGAARWNEFCARLSELSSPEPERELIVGAAREAFERLAAIADAMDADPYLPGRDALSFLNVKAGDHAVTHDPRETLAAFDAGLVTWTAFPYMAARYGDRGLRFTHSDSAWLVTLAHASQSEADRHTSWLSRVLASRGMPSFLLEDQLRHLHDALCDAVPERASRYVRLARAADRLRDLRLQALPAFADLAASFGGEGEPRNVGPLIASAVADEHNAVGDAVASLVGWLQDPERFPPAWIDAVGDLVARARRA